MPPDSDAARLWRAAVALSAAAGTPDLPPLLCLTDPDRTPEPWRVAARLPAGSAVIHRGFGRPEAADEARRLRETTRAAGVKLLIGLDSELAEAVGADGVHLPERRAGLAASLRDRHPDWLITAAWHPSLTRLAVTPDDAQGPGSGAQRGASGAGFQALGFAEPRNDEDRGGIDALVVSPVFTPGGASSGKPLGVAGLAAAVAASALPVYALGGIHTDNAQSLIGSGACGIAAVGGIVSAFGG